MEEKTDEYAFEKYLCRRRKFSKITRIVLALTISTFIFVASEYLNQAEDFSLCENGNDINPFFSIEIENQNENSFFGIAKINDIEYAFSIDKKVIHNIYQKAGEFYGNFIPGGIIADK